MCKEGRSTVAECNKSPCMNHKWERIDYKSHHVVGLKERGKEEEENMTRNKV